MYFLGPPCRGKNRGREIGGWCSVTGYKISISPRYFRRKRNTADSGYGSEQPLDRRWSQEFQEVIMTPSPPDHLICDHRWGDFVSNLHPCMTQICLVTQPRRMPFWKFLELLIIAHRNFANVSLYLNLKRIKIQF